MELQVLLHIHAVVNNPYYNDMGFCASPVKDDMATLAEFFVPWLDIVRIAAYFRLARKQFECIIKLLEVFTAYKYW